MVEGTRQGKGRQGKTVTWERGKTDTTCPQYTPEGLRGEGPFPDLCVVVFIPPFPSFKTSVGRPGLRDTMVKVRDTRTRLIDRSRSETDRHFAPTVIIMYGVPQ